MTAARRIRAVLNPPPPGRRRPTPTQRGFTLIEILVSITLIGALVSILLPSLASVRRAMKISASKAIMSVIDGACMAYQNDWHAFPPSQDDEGLPDWYGSEILTLLLTGYADDAGGDGTPTTELFEDDGRENFGFRVAARGKVYGPYGGAEKLRVIEGANGLQFADTFNNPILYYRYDDGAEQDIAYDPNDNDGPSDKDFPRYVMSRGDDTETTADDRYYRQDFVLFSAGPDGDFSAPRDGGDDITNFFEERRREGL